MTWNGLEPGLWPILIILVGLMAGQSSAADCPAECECNTEVNCAHRGLSEFPSFSDVSIRNIHLLKLSGNRFKEFPRQYSNITNLSHLNLSDNYIDKLDVDAFKGFEHLFSLSLANNSIASWADINANVSFKVATGLYSLNLRGNRLSTFGFDNGLISNSIVTLDISSAHISTVNFSWADQLPKLLYLYMANNNLAKVRQLIIPTTTWELDISNCSLQQINLSSNCLHSLKLSYNPAMQLNFSDIHFYNLNWLDLSYCNLDRIDLRNMPDLRELRLRGNKLKSINANTFANNPELIYLHLSENELRVIEHEGFSSLKKLEFLNLTINKISQIDENLISGNTVLKDLFLSMNNIQKLPKIVSKSLRFLNLSGCNITTIEDTALSSLSAIETLHLSHNLIEEIPCQLESNTLLHLDLSYCRGGELSLALSMVKRYRAAFDGRSVLSIVLDSFL
ncbi:hypothetical protein ACLKA7_000559 [Drosophila subpalustris]